MAFSKEVMIDELAHVAGQDRSLPAGAARQTTLPSLPTAAVMWW